MKALAQPVLFLRYNSPIWHSRNRTSRKCVHQRSIGELPRVILAIGRSYANEENGGGMKTIKHIMRLKGRDMWTTSPDASVYEALKVMAEKDIGAMPVLDGQKLVGIFSERDYARKVILKGKSSKKTPVSEIMSTNLVTIAPDQTNEQGLVLMTTKHIRHLPVMQGQKLVGFISIGDLVKSIIDEQKQVIDKMEQYIGEKSGMY